jgi:hypothetical protein
MPSATIRRRHLARVQLSAAIAPADLPARIGRSASARALAYARFAAASVALPSCTPRALAAASAALVRALMSRQGQSELGLEAQRAAVEIWLNGGRWQGSVGTTVSHVAALENDP